MELNLTTTDKPPSYSSISATSEYPPHPQPTAPEYHSLSEPDGSYGSYPTTHTADSSRTRQPVHRVPSFAGHIAFACVVFWCCNWLFGLIAFILASKYSSFFTYRTAYITCCRCSRSVNIIIITIILCGNNRIWMFCSNIRLETKTSQVRILANSSNNRAA